MPFYILAGLMDLEEDLAKRASKLSEKLDLDSQITSQRYLLDAKKIWQGTDMSYDQSHIFANAADKKTGADKTAYNK